MSAESRPVEELGFEEARAELEAIVAAIDDGDIDIDTLSAQVARAGAPRMRFKPGWRHRSGPEHFASRHRQRVLKLAQWNPAGTANSSEKLLYSEKAILRHGHRD